MSSDKTLRGEILDEAHSSVHVMHLGSTNIYRDLREHYRWVGMKKEITQFVARCLACEQVKAEHQRLAGLLIS